MNNKDRLINDLLESHIFRDLYEKGGTPDSIKKEIINTLNPFFRNNYNLENNAINFLTSDYINLLRVRKKYQNIDEDLLLVLSTYYEAMLVNEKLLYEIVSESILDQAEAGNNYWTFIHFERDKQDLELYEFAKESFTNIEDIVEGVLKYLLITDLAINRLLKGENPNHEKINNTRLGRIIEELILLSKYSHLFKTFPDELKISDWRNIAAHKSYYIENDKVVCSYGVSHCVKSFRLSRDELFDKVNQVFRTLDVLNLAKKFFVYDNYDKIEPLFRSEKNLIKHNVTRRDEIWLLFFISSIYSQGFEVLRFDYEPNGKALMVLRDFTELNPEIRSCHSSQFVYPIYCLTLANEITVEYRLKNDKLFVRSSSTKNICERIAKGHEPLAYLAEELKFEIY